VDFADSLLLLLGVRLSERPPDTLHPLGHGQDVYFWSLVVAMVIFGVGGGVTVYEGVHRLSHPQPVEHVAWSYWTLGVCGVFEGTSWVIGLREFLRRKRPGESVWRAFRRSKDPTVFTVLVEDTTDLVGLLAAFAGIYFGRKFNNPHIDALASVVIGATLSLVALVLGYESRGLLLGEAADPLLAAAIRTQVARDEAVAGVGRLLTVQIGPHDVLATVAVKLRAGSSLADVERAVERVRARVTAEHPDVKYFFIEPAATIDGGRVPTGGE
jgi:cation diffusion facilitator family transporter